MEHAGENGGQLSVMEAYSVKQQLQVTNFLQV